MQKLFREYVTPAFLLMIKLFTVIRTGLDTLIVAGAFAAEVTTIQFVNAVLYVVLIDAVLTGLWLYSAYGSEGKQGQLLKIFSIVGAWALYIGMVVIGWSAHPEAPFLAMMGRLAGAIALGYDTWGYISGPIRNSLLSFGKWLKRKFSGPTPDDAYRTAFNRELVNVLRKTGPEIRELVRDTVSERIASELPRYVLNALPFPEEIGPGSEENRKNFRESPKRVYSSAIARAWETCRENLEAEGVFGIDDIMGCTGKSKSRAYDIINYGKEVASEIETLGQNVYVFHPKSANQTIIQDSSDPGVENPIGHTTF